MCQNEKEYDLLEGIKGQYTILALLNDHIVVDAIKARYENLRNIHFIKAERNLVRKQLDPMMDLVLLLINWDDPQYHAPPLPDLMSDYSNVAIILLSEDINDINRGIRYGIDDFVLKPYQVSEVIARLDNRIIQHQVGKERKRIIQAGQLMINVDNRIVYKGEKIISLSAKQFNTLVFLTSRRGQVFSKRQIYSQVWEESFDYYDRNMTSYISKLHNKLEPDIRKPIYILTKWGFGYYFNDKI